jgi:hypothetical protein
VLRCETPGHGGQQRESDFAQDTSVTHHVGNRAGRRALDVERWTSSAGRRALDVDVELCPAGGDAVDDQSRDATSRHASTFEHAPRSALPSMPTRATAQTSRVWTSFSTLPRCTGRVRASSPRYVEGAEHRFPNSEKDVRRRAPTSRSGLNTRNSQPPTSVLDRSCSHIWPSTWPSASDSLMREPRAVIHFGLR